MIESSTLVLAAQADGFGMNAVTLGVITAAFGVMATVITVLWRAVTRDKERLERENERLEQEKADLTEALIDSLRTGHRATDVADEAARELLKQRRARKPR